MIASDANAEMTTRRVNIRRIVASAVLGLIVGMLAYYLIAIAATAQIPGDFRINPLALLLIAIVGGVAVTVGWKWPVAGLSAGILILLIVAFAVAGRIAWSPAQSEWLSPFNAVAFGAASGYPTMLGAVTVTVSALTLRSRRAR